MLNAFVFPDVENIEEVPKENIVRNLKKCLECGKTRRQKSYFKFGVKFDSLEMR
jgi:hypothetical protein